MAHILHQQGGWNACTTGHEGSARRRKIQMDHEKFDAPERCKKLCRNGVPEEIPHRDSSEAKPNPAEAGIMS